MTGLQCHEQVVKAMREPDRLIAGVSLSPDMWYALSREEYSFMAHGGNVTDTFAEFGERVYFGRIWLQKDQTLERGFIVWCPL